MDPINTNDIGNLLMNSEGTCPCCGSRLTVIAGLLSAKQAGIEDISVCRCPQCGHVFRYELKAGGLEFTEDLTDTFVPGKPEVAEEAAESAAEETVKAESKPRKKARKTKDCPKCGARVPIKDSVCPKCGEAFPEEETAVEDAEEKTVIDLPAETPAPVEEAVAETEPLKAAAIIPETDDLITEIVAEAVFRKDEEEEMKTCPKCGKSIPARAQYCPYCRKHLVESKAAAGFRKYRLVAAVALAVIALIVAAVIYLPTAAKSKSYNQALKLVKSGEYQQAVDAFNELGDYQKARQYASYCQAVLNFNAGNLEGAEPLFRASGSVENANNYLSYLSGIEKLKANSVKAADYTSAADDFKKAGDIADALSMETFARAIASFINDSFENAVASLRSVIDDGKVASSYLKQAKEIVSYVDAVTRLENHDEKALADLSSVLTNASPLVTRKAGDYATYIEAMNAYNDKKFYTAWCAFNSIDILDAEQMAASCIQSRPGSGIVYRSGSSKSVSLTIYDTSDGEDLFIKIYNSSDTLVETLYIRDGGKATAYLPTGSFRIALASGNGSQWYGPKETFGPAGRYQRLLLTGSAEYYSFNSGKYTLKFNVSNGNVNTKSSDYGDV
ncbi:MAG: zinc-ribbon domain-containing protein [Erysipelotrichaceae bacterium]|nr:zinc-ribbon domain-containing protein [Erysipelotrichaceae bacterium]